MISVKRWVPAIFVAAITTIAADAAQAEFPEHPVRIVIGYAPGGGTDVLARLISQKLSDKWGQQVIVDNKPGAGGTIANDTVAHAVPDGYTIAMMTNDFTVAPAMFPLNYDSIKSFTQITMLAETPDVFLVNSAFPVNSLKEMIALAKTKPGQMNFGSSGVGSVPSLEMFLFMKQTGIKMTHVAYKGTGPAQVGLMGDEVQSLFGAVATSLPLIKSGKAKPLAISSPTRIPLLPDVPTVAEAANLPGFEGGVSYGVLAPPGTPANIAAKLREDFIAATNSPEIKKSLSDQGFATVGNSPDEFRKIVASDMTKWSAMVKETEAK